MYYTDDKRLGSVKLIAIDMDGTLLKSDHITLPKENGDAIRRADAAGIRVCICTGRMIEDASDFIRRCDLPCMIIAGNGTRASTGPMPEGKMLLRHDIPAEDALRAIDILLPTGLMINGFQDGMVNTVLSETKLHYHLIYRGLIGERLGEDALREAAREGIMKLFAVGGGFAGDIADERIPSALATLRHELPHLQITSSAPGNIEIMGGDAGKGAALREVAEDIMGITREQVMAIGDAGNDLTMLEYAGQSVAMGNATPEVKAACCYETATNDECGVAKIIERVLAAKEML